MCFLLLLLLLLAILAILPSISADVSPANKQCLKKAPSKLTPTQSTTLCSTSSKDPISPALCATTIFKGARSNHPLSHDDIVRLCTTATDPVRAGTCASTLNGKKPKLSEEEKINICRHESSTSFNMDCVTSLKVPKDKSPASEFPAPSFLAAFCSHPNQTAPSPHCANSLPSSKYPASSKTTLCATATSDAPATQCAASKKLPSSLTPSQTATLCANAVTDAPITCLKHVPSLFTLPEAITLCQGAKDPSPATCATAFDARALRKVGVPVAIDLCAHAPADHPTAPAVCANTANPKLATGDIVDLCKTATSPDSMKCFKDVAPFLHDVKAAKVLCDGATDSDMIIKCVNALPYTMEPMNKARVCYRAESTAPAQCATLLDAGGGNLASSTYEEMVTKQGDIVDLCGGVKDVGPAVCFGQSPKKLSKAMRAELCAGAMSTFVETEKNGKEAVKSGVALCATTALAHNLSPSMAIILCRSHLHAITSPETATGPVDCAITLSHPFSPQDVLTLCEGARDSGPARCAKSVDASFDVGMRARVCEGAEGFTPARCIEHLPPSIPRAKAVEICRGAATLTPAYCAASLRKQVVTEEDVAGCRRAVSAPSKLQVKDIEFEGMELLPGTNIKVKIHVMDQFDQKMAWDNETYVTAKLDPRGAGGAVLDGSRVGITTEGVVAFEELQVNMEGNFSLKFFLDDKAEIYDPNAATVRVRVGQDPLEKMMSGVCKGLFESFSCFVGDAGGEKEGEERSKITYPSSMKFLPCVEILEDAGFKVTWGWGGELWLSSKSGVEELSRFEITGDMNFWDRLGVPLGSSKGQVRKAYFKKSLQWHPDRWVKYPHLVDKVSAVFSMVSEAYEGLMGCLEREINGDGVCE